MGYNTEKTAIITHSATLQTQITKRTQKNRNYFVQHFCKKSVDK